MSNNAVKHSPAWINFSIGSFAIAAAMMAGGIFFLEASFAAKGFYAMSALMLVHTSISVTKTLRDNEEATKFINKVEDAKTEKLLMDINNAED